MTDHTIESIQTRPVRTRQDEREFLELPYRLYKGDAHWVAPLRIAQKDILNTRKHPFYKTSDVEKFIVSRNGRVVGRVMAIVNRAYNDFHHDRSGFFGFFESENDPEAVRSLLNAAREWLRGRGADSIVGPVNPSTNYECGLLVDGFDLDPMVMMSYNHPYYATLLEEYGMKKAMDLYAYEIAESYFNHSNKLQRVADRLRKKDGISIRTVNLKDFSNEVVKLRNVYNDAWSRNWGFVPFSEEEFNHMAKDLKQIVDSRIVMIAEKKKEDGSTTPIGFFLAIPDVNQALKRINGRLLPFGIIKLLWHSRKISSIRIITMGAIREYQPRGIGSIFLDEIYRRAPAAGYPTGEMSWVLENNVMMNRAADLIGGRLNKVYRIYTMPVD